MVLGVGWPIVEWKMNLLVSSKLNKIYSVQYFVTYVNKIHWNLFHKVNEGEVCISLCHFFFSSLPCEYDAIFDNIMVRNGVVIKQVRLLCLIEVLCSGEVVDTELDYVGLG